MKSALAPIYLDNAPLDLDDQEEPSVAQILAHAGLGEGVRLRRMRFLGDKEGRPVHTNETLDRRSHPSNPILLQAVERSSDRVRP